MNLSVHVTLNMNLLELQREMDGNYKIIRADNEPQSLIDQLNTK